MRITIVFPYNIWSGAFRSTYELANRMAARGHDVEVNFPFFPFLNGESLFSRNGLGLLAVGLARSIVRRNRVPWFDLKVPVRVVPWIDDRFVRDADVIMANHWQTQHAVARLSPSKGRKFNFVRDSEPYTSGPVLESYRQPMEKIVSLPWLKEFLEGSVGVPVRGVVPNGLNIEQFGVREKKSNTPPVVSMLYYPGDPRKGMDDGLEALRAIKQRHPDVVVQLFGWFRPPKLDFLDRFHLRPVKDALRDIYAGTDIFLSPSRAEGYHNPPREAMAAQCAVVATNVGSIPLCAIPGKTAIVVEPGDVAGMIDGISYLIDHPAERRDMGAAAYEHIKRFDWEASTTTLLEIFSESAAGDAHVPLRMSAQR